MGSLWFEINFCISILKWPNAENHYTWTQWRILIFYQYNAVFVGFALECYVCLGQRTNKDKCIKTTIQCEQEQDACKTQIRWQRKYFYILCQAYLISVSITFLDRIPLEKFQLSWYHINLFIKGEIKGENKWNIYFCMYRIEWTSLWINNFEIFFLKIDKISYL